MYFAAIGIDLNSPVDIVAGAGKVAARKRGFSQCNRRVVVMLLIAEEQP